MYVFGGYNGVAWLNDIFYFDLVLMHWRYIAIKGYSPCPREGHSMVLLADKLLLFGGWDGTALGDLITFDTKTNEFAELEQTGACPHLCGHSMNTVGDKLFLFGGYNGQRWANELLVLQVVGIQGKWENALTGGCPVGRGYHTAVKVNNYLLVYAGFDGTSILSDLLVLDTETLNWSTPDPGTGFSPSARNAHTMTLYKSEVYIFGGYNGVRDTNEMHLLETSAFSSLHDDFARAYANLGSYTVRLVASKGSVPVHSVIIKHRCPTMFQELLAAYPDFLRDKTRKVHSLSIGDYSQKSLDIICEFIYSDLLRQDLSYSVRDEVLVFAIKYNLPRLMSLCFFKTTGTEVAAQGSSFVLELMSCQSDRELSDVTVMVEGQAFYLHRCILSARCSYFTVMFNSPLRESKLEVVSISNIKSAAFRVIVDWIYSDKFPPLFGDNEMSQDQGVDLLIASNMLDLQSLMRMTEIVLQRKIALNTVVQLYELSYMLSANYLRSYCVNYVLREFDNLVNMPDFSSISKPALDFLITFLPRRMTRQVNREPNKSQLSLVKLANDENANKLAPIVVHRVPTQSPKSPKTYKFLLPKYQNIPLTERGNHEAAQSSKKRGIKRLKTIDFTRTTQFREGLDPNFVLTPASKGALNPRLKKSKSIVFKNTLGSTDLFKIRRVSHK